MMMKARLWSMVAYRIFREMGKGVMSLHQHQRRRHRRRHRHRRVSRTCRVGRIVVGLCPIRIGAMRIVIPRIAEGLC